ncbi:MAG: MltA domain-containing protein [Proteobacteria bacterium]|nr:MltA domain-containing protein [Pseudomonadota bacterium]
MRRALLALGFLAFVSPAMSSPAPPEELARLPEGARAIAHGFADLPGWAEDDHAAAFVAFRVTCESILAEKPALRDALPASTALVEACRAAMAAGTEISRTQARRFFEAYFQPFEILPASGNGFLTAYYEPELEASASRNDDFPVPVLARPADLVTLKQGETRPGLDPKLQSARQTAAGLEPFPDRAAIWAGILDGQGLEIAWLRDHADLFITQVQGSARVKFTDGSRARLVYAGRNGHPYTSVGRKIVESGGMALEEMTLAKLMAYLRADSARGRALMEQNRSYVFFALDRDLPADQGPIGGAGVPLTSGRSLAVDRTIWPYGLPVFIETNPLTPAGPRARIARLMVAQDTGSAILGPARGDYFMGSGAQAGDRAGLVRDSMRFIILLPRGAAK